MKNVKITKYGDFKPEQFDLLVIKDQANMASGEKIMRIFNVTKDYYLTKDYRFSKKDLHCMEKGKESLIIDSVIVNLKRRLCERLRKNNYIIHMDSDKATAKIKTQGGTQIEMTMLDKKHEDLFLNIDVNWKTVFMGRIENKEEFNTIYKTTLKHILGHELL